MLNKKQQEAILNQDRFVFLYAGAGTGKTTVMIEKIKYLMQTGYQGSSILALTFTKEAAIQMRERLNIDEVTIETFHAWVFHQLKDVSLIPEDAPFSNTMLLKISQYKNQHQTSHLPIRFYKYSQYLKQYPCIDYDDLLIKGINEKGFGKSYSFILIDEFQDTNYLQLQLLLYLVKSETRVFAVGDPDQSIYKFRGAIPRIVEEFIHIFNAKTLYLSSNYRSYTYIIALANHLISYDRNRVKKKLIPSFDKKGVLQYKIFKDMDEEAHFLYEYIITLKNSIAILCRTHQRMFQIKNKLFDRCLFLETNNIQLLTMHQAKGLEFDHVIVVGLEQQTIPGRNTWDQESLNEERRLLFVAITRAKQSIIFTRVKSMGKPSQFLPELNLKP